MLHEDQDDPLPSRTSQERLIRFMAAKERARLKGGDMEGEMSFQEEEGEDDADGCLDRASARASAEAAAAAAQESGRRSDVEPDRNLSGMFKHAMEGTKAGLRWLRDSATGVSEAIRSSRVEMSVQSTEEEALDDGVAVKEAEQLSPRKPVSRKEKRRRRRLGRDHDPLLPCMNPKCELAANQCAGGVTMCSAVICGLMLIFLTAAVMLQLISDECPKFPDDCDSY